MARKREGVTTGAYLLVVESDASLIFPLPQTGVVVIGRGKDVELALAHSSVSRRHARIRVEDGAMWIADLGSDSGTSVNGEPITREHGLASGDIAMIGDVACAVHMSQRMSSPVPALGTLPPRPVASEAEWTQRLSEELELARSRGRTFAVLAVFAAETTPGALGPALRTMDVLGQTDKGQPRILLPDADRTLARATALAVLAIAPKARIGIALFPTDAIESDTVVFAARIAALRAKPGGVAEWTDLGHCLDGR